MSSRQRSYLSIMNRLFIFSLTVAGLLMDGFQNSDIPCTIAMIIWLWLPLFIKIEAKAISFINEIQQNFIRQITRGVRLVRSDIRPGQ